MKEFKSRSIGILFCMLFLLSSMVILIPEEVESVGEPMVTVQLSSSSVDLGDPREEVEVQINGELTCSDEDFDTRDVEVSLAVSFDYDIALDVLVDPEIITFSEGAGNASFIITFKPYEVALAGEHEVLLRVDYSYRPVGGSGEIGEFPIMVNVDEYAGGNFILSSLAPTVDPDTGSVDIDIAITNQGNALHDFFLDIENYDKEVMRVTPTGMSLLLSPFITHNGEITFEAVEQDRYWIEPVSIVLYDSDTGEEYDRTDIEVVYTPGEGPIDPPEADVDITITKAYYIIWKGDDSFGVEVLIEGTTSGCEEIHLYMGLPGSEDDLTAENLLAQEEMDIEMEGGVPGEDITFNTRAQFRDTSSRGDWSRFEYIQQVTYTGPEEDLDTGYSNLLSAVGSDLLILVEAYPDRTDDDLFSERIEYISVSEGDRRDTGSTDDDAALESLKTSDDSNLKLYLIISLLAVFGLIVMIGSYAFIARR